jgi:hypothetical protein
MHTEESITMPKTILDAAETFLLAIFLVSGGLGGCAAASKFWANGAKFRWAIFFSYLILGVFFGVMSYGVHQIVGWQSPSSAALSSGLIAFAGATIVTGSNISAKILLKKLGIEVDVNIKRVNRDKQDP